MVSADYIQQGLVQRGLPAHIAQGFVMNMRDESGLNPGINERAPLVQGSRGGYGLYQLTGPRRRAYESYASSRGVAFDNADAQLDFLMSELQGPEKRAAQSIFSTDNPQDAAVAIARDFLRPAASNLQKRVASYTGNKDPQATASTQGTAPMMQQEEETPRGLLGGLGIQKMQEGAPGETGQRFYERDSFKDTAALLAQGFGRMGIMGMEEIADGIAKQRTEAKAKNKTVEYLRKAGRNDLADMVEQNLIGGKDAAAALLKKPATGEVREIDGKLVRVMPDGTVTELYASESPAELTADMREYDLAKEQGFTGSFIEFIQAQKGGGLQIRTNPDGTTEIIQGGPAATKLTEGQSKATGFFARSSEANDILSGLEQEGTELRNVFSGALPFGNYMRTPEGQQYDQAKRNFINAVLRQESGAVIGPSEFASAEVQYFPQPGDSPEVIAQKRANRETAVRALEVSAGPGAGAIGASAPSGGGVTDDPLGLRN